MPTHKLTFNMSVDPCAHRHLVRLAPLPLCPRRFVELIIENTTARSAIVVLLYSLVKTKMRIFFLVTLLVALVVATSAQRVAKNAWKNGQRVTKITITIAVRFDVTDTSTSLKSERSVHSGSPISNRINLTITMLAIFF